MPWALQPTWMWEGRAMQEQLPRCAGTANPYPAFGLTCERLACLSIQGKANLHHLGMTRMREQIRYAL